MFKKYTKVVINESDMSDLMQMASNYGLLCEYKIGVYGKNRQHELFIFGSRWNIEKFKRSAKDYVKNKKSSET